MGSGGTAIGTDYCFYYYLFVCNLQMYSVIYLKNVLNFFFCRISMHKKIFRRENVEALKRVLKNDAPEYNKFHHSMDLCGHFLFFLSFIVPQKYF